ncbi:MAG: hypothetical protein HZC01_00215 [Candidatus Kerfeldbacteria bacterium]|nr:hypothetical protein [Candidatus Kerfeldbacteria bacterium]
MAQSLIFLAALCNLFLGTFLFVKSKNNIQRQFSFVVFVITIWNLVNLQYFMKPEYPFVNFSYAAGSLVVSSIFLWVLSYAKIHLSIIQKVCFFIIVASVFISSLIPDAVILQNIVVKDYGFEIGIGRFFLFFAILVTAQLLVLIGVLLKHLRNTTGIVRLQTKYIFLGFTVPAIFVILVDFILPYFSYTQFSSFDMLSTLVFALAISYAIFRYRFFDIQLVIKEGLTHFISLAALLAFYVYLLLLSRDFVSQEYNWSEQATTIVLVLIIATTFEPLRRITTKLVHTVFISREKNAQEKVNRLQLLFGSTVQFETLIEKSLSALESFLSVKQSNFMYRDLAAQKMTAARKLDPQLDIEGAGYAYLTHKPEILVTEEIPYRMEEVGADEREQLQKIQPELQQAGISMVVPIGEPGELFGLFLFGQKARSAAFTEDNIKYIKELQPHMTSAIANALMYKQAMERIGRK